MDNYILKQVKTNKDILEFLNLPKKLYKFYKKEKFLTQDKKVEKQILTQKHVLSNDFNIIAFIVTKNNKAITRGILTLYNNDDTAFFGFYESFDDSEANHILFKEIKRQAKLHNKKQIIGPVNCSIWLGYRFKIDYFDNIYTNEPYNLPFYEKLWTNEGFSIYKKYYSNQLRTPSKEDIDAKCKKRLKYIKENGYIIRNTSKKIFLNDLKIIYNLITKLYSSFPAFKYINESEFINMFSKLKYILNYDLVYLAFKDNKCVGFMVCVPNYGNTSNLFNLLKKPKEYVMLYLGVENGHFGLGGAFAELCKEYLSKNNYSCISALIQEGKVSGTYYKELLTNTYNYILMSQKIQ